MATMLKSNDSAIKAMQELLRQRCEAEPQFAIRMANSDRTMEQAVAYLCQEVQKMRVCMLDDATVMNILVHFYPKSKIIPSCKKAILSITTLDALLAKTAWDNNSMLSVSLKRI